MSADSVRIKEIYKGAMDQKQVDIFYRQKEFVNFNFDEDDYQKGWLNVPLWFIEKKGISK